MELRRIVIPLVSVFALFVAMAVATLRRPPAPRPGAVPRPRWPMLALHTAATAAGGYLFFLAIVLVFHVVIAGQRGALRSAAAGGAFLAFGVVLPAFAVLSWLERARRR